MKKRLSLENIGAVYTRSFIKKKGKGIGYQDELSLSGKSSTAGITLVALVVTIVVLFILAGITLVYVFGDNGIIKLAQEAKQKTEEGMQKEQNDLGNLVNMLKEESDNEVPKEEKKTMQVEVRGYTSEYDGGEHNEFSYFQIKDENGIDITDKVTVAITRTDLNGKPLDRVSEKVRNVMDSRIVYYTISYSGYHDVADSTTVKITQKDLIITTQSATKPYDGTPLTNKNGQLEGLTDTDKSVTLITTGSQTGRGTSVNSYRLEWGSVISQNYKIIENLGFLTVTSPSI